MARLAADATQHVGADWTAPRLHSRHVSDRCHKCCVLQPTCDSTSSKAFACWSQRAALRMSANLMHPLLLLYAKMLQ